MSNVNLETLYNAVVKGKGNDIYLVRVGGLDELGLHLDDVPDNYDVNERVLRVSTNTFTGTRNVTLRLNTGDSIIINRLMYGLSAVALNGVKTIESKQFMAISASNGKSLVNIIKEPELFKTVDLHRSQQFKAVDYLINDLVGMDNLVIDNRNTHIDTISFSPNLRLSEASQYSSVVYELTGAGKGSALSKAAINSIRAELQAENEERMLPEGKVYLKVPTKVKELVLCGNPNTTDLLKSSMDKSNNYCLYPSTDDTYFVLPNITL